VAFIPISVSPQDDISINLPLAQDNLHIASISSIYGVFTSPLIHNVDVVAANRPSESSIAFGIGADSFQVGKQAAGDIHGAKILRLGNDSFNNREQEKVSMFLLLLLFNVE
jgi:hypothetical protein